MSTLICGGCTARYSVGAEKCPQCGANEPRAEHEQRLNLHSLNVECGNEECAAHGIRRRVLLNVIAPGVLAWPALLCATCGLHVTYIPDEPQQEEVDMPKVTVHTGPSNEAAELLAADGEQSEQGQPAGQPEPADAEGGEDVSPSTSSSTSSEKPQTSPGTSETETPKPALKTASRSGKGRTASSTARSTGGAQTDSAADGDEG